MDVCIEKKEIYVAGGQQGVTGVGLWVVASGSIWMTTLVHTGGCYDVVFCMLSSPERRSGTTLHNW